MVTPKLFDSKSQVKFAAFLSLSFALLYASAWWPLKSQGIGGGHTYDDLWPIQHSAICYKTLGRAVFTTSNSCEYQYGEFLLRFLGFFRLDRVSTFLLGGFFFVGVATLLIVVAYKCSLTKGQAIFSSLLVLSTGPWLLFERGNFDSLLILFLAIAVFFSNSKFTTFQVLLVAMTSLMKFYTLPLLFMMSLTEKNRVNKILALIMGVICTPLILRDILSAGQGHPNPLFAAFGLPAPGLWVNWFSWRLKFPIKLSLLSTYLVGVVAAGVAVYLLIFSKFRKVLGFNHFSVRGIHGWRRSTFLFSSCVYISCFFTGMSYDYRLTYLIFALITLNFFVPDIFTSKLFLAIELGAVWLTYFWFGKPGVIPIFLALAGNVCQLYLAIYILKILISEISNGSIPRRLKS